MAVNLREVTWSKMLGITAAPLPKMCPSFGSSSAWKRQQEVLAKDCQRMPAMHYNNVQKIVMRHAATMPNHGYIQGNLYILYALGLVFRDEASMFWAYSRMCHRLSRFGPDADLGTAILPQWLLKQAQQLTKLDVDALDVIIRLRWLFIMFGQTFTKYNCLQAVWDFCIADQHHLYALAFVLLEFASAQPSAQCACPIETASAIFSIQIDDATETAQLIAKATQFCAS